MLSELATGNNRSGPVSSPVQLFASRQARIARRELARASHESPHTDALHPVRRGARRHGAQHALLSHRATPLGRSFRVTHVTCGFLEQINVMDYWTGVPVGCSKAKRQ